MQYVIFDKKDKGRLLSRFGLGCMRLPKTKRSDGTEIIDEKESIRMIRHAIDSGVNYIDTAYIYPGSEEVIGKALADGYRQKVWLVTKTPVCEVKNSSDYEKFFIEQLERLKTDYIDIYLLHCLDGANWKHVKETGGMAFMESLKKKGKIGRIGFSFHADHELFVEIIDAYDWDMCMIQLNILDENHQAGIKGLRHAASKGIPVVIMEPLKGGLLGGNVPEEIAILLNEYAEKRSLAEWAFRWLYNFSEATVIISGVSTMTQLEDNLRIFADAKPNSMSEKDMELVLKIKQIYDNKVKIGCSGCGYCLPCPAGINIPEVFKIYNDAYVFEDPNTGQTVYSMVIADSGHDASGCIACGHCEKHCPQELPIIETLKEAHSVLKA